jgi:nucleolar protein 14
MHKNLKNGLAHGALQTDSKTWPGISELALLRTIGTIWPSSDMNHAVISPARLLMGAYLGLARVRSLSDIGSGLFLCTLFLQFEELSKRFVPEAINFLVNTVLHLAPHSYKDCTSLPGSFSSPDFMSALCVPLSIADKKAPSLSPLKPNLVDLLSESGPREQAKVDALGLALELNHQFANMNKAVDGFIELYSPVQEVLLAVNGSRLSQGLRVCGFSLFGYV